MTTSDTFAAIDRADEREWLEWGVRRTWGDVGSIAYFERDYRTARKCAKDWPGELVHRVVTASDWVDGQPTEATR